MMYVNMSASYSKNIWAFLEMLGSAFFTIENIISILLKRSFFSIRFSTEQLSLCIYKRQKVFEFFLSLREKEFISTFSLHFIFLLSDEAVLGSAYYYIAILIH